MRSLSMSIFDPPPIHPPPPAPLGVLLISGTYERAHYALVVATAAAAVGRPVTLFATNGGCRAFLGPAADGTPGWAALEAHGLGSARGALARDARLREQGVAGFAELLASAAELGVRLVVCDAGLKAEGLRPEQLDATLNGEVAGVVTFLAETEAGQIITL